MSRVFPEEVKSLHSQLPSRQRGTLAEKFDEYKNAIIDGLTTIYSATLLTWIAPEVMRALEAHPQYLELIEAQDALLLYTILAEICLRLGGDKLGKIEEDIADHVQQAGMTFTAFKSVLDRLIEKYRLYNRGEKMSERTQVRYLLAAVNPVLYDDALQLYHKAKVPPLYADVCQNFQAIEDAAQWAISNRARHLRKQFGTSAPLLAAVTKGKTTFCSICFQRHLTKYGTGKEFPHAESACHNKEWERSL